MLLAPIVMSPIRHRVCLVIIGRYHVRDEGKVDIRLMGKQGFHDGLDRRGVRDIPKLPG
jgi:hypothetical protein